MLFFLRTYTRKTVLSFDYSKLYKNYYGSLLDLLLIKLLSIPSTSLSSVFLIGFCNI